ncbi:helix-turn-helix domain-containing protein [Sphingopyxis witflariensis]|uniref:helix-turn-helix domain-containing protein n=1 Tax=Sphingopyxis witflariensis TaxID=173675 RepID=UPI0013033D12|nr:helix-turn-helix domain-containing protein [Sphingopyxis witflariensis]
MQELRAGLRPGAHGQEIELRFRKGEIIFFQGDRSDGWFEVVSGIVRTCRFHIDGHRQLTGFYYKGDAFGVECGRREAAAEAVTNAILSRHFAAAGELESSSQNHALERALESANQCIFLLGRRNANERVAAFLLIAAERLESPESIPLPMPRSDIADHLGLTIHTVSRTISGFVRRGLIELDGPQMCRIIDVEGLMAVAGEEVEAAIERLHTAGPSSVAVHPRGERL